MSNCLLGEDCGNLARIEALEGALEKATEFIKMTLVNDALAIGCEQEYAEERAAKILKARGIEG